VRKDTKVVGVDVDDRGAQICALDGEAQILQEKKIPLTQTGIRGYFQEQHRVRVVTETGTHSPWLSRLLESLGHEVIVANARKLRMIYTSDRKNDKEDARMLARLGLADPALLCPIRHRSAQAQMDLELLKARDTLVSARTKLINHVRGALKSIGERAPRCSAECFHKKAEPSLPEGMREFMLPLLGVIGDLTDRIKGYEKQIKTVAQEKYPEVKQFTQVRGVGLLTALAYVLTLEDPSCFKRSRSVAAYLGLTTKQKQSGKVDKQLRITKAGDAGLRRLLVQCANYMMGPFGEDCDLRRFGMKLYERGGRASRKKAMVAVARKLAVLLHALWKTGEVYDPFRQVKRRQEQAA